VPQGSDVIGTPRGRATAFTCASWTAHQPLRRLRRDGVITEIALPFDGTIGAVYAVPGEDARCCRWAGWLTPTGIYAVDSRARVADTGITPRPAIDVTPYEVKRSFAAAQDGTKIPYTLLYRKDLKLDGRAPTWISAYALTALPPTRRLRRALAGADRRRRHRRLRQCARRRRIRP